MPYIDKKQRERFDIHLNELNSFANKGELEYCIFKLMCNYMNDRIYNYSNLHSAVYSAQHCSDEFRRRFLDKREDEAKTTNGDINFTRN